MFKQIQSISIDILLSGRLKFFKSVSKWQVDTVLVSFFGPLLTCTTVRLKQSKTKAEVVNMLPLCYQLFFPS